MASPDCSVATTFQPLNGTLTSPTVTIRGGTVSLNGASVPAITATWPSFTDPYVYEVEFSYQRSGLTDPAKTGYALAGSGSWIGTDGVVPNANYVVMFRPVGEAPGPWSSPVTVTVGSLAAVTIVNQGSNATTNLYIQATAPSNPNHGDLWFDESTSPYTWRAWDGSAWRSTVRVTYATTAPGSPFEGDLWINTTTTPYVIQRYTSGSWNTVSTVGATTGLNLYSSSYGVLNDNSVYTPIGTAAAFTSQTAWATYTGLVPGTVAGQVSQLQTDGYIESATIYKSGLPGGGNQLSVFWPQEAGANITETRIASGIHLQGSGATANTLAGLNSRDYNSLFAPKSANLVVDSTGKFGGRGWIFSGGGQVQILNGYDWTSAYRIDNSGGCTSPNFNFGAGLQYTLQVEMSPNSATGGTFDMSCDIEYLKSDLTNNGYSNRLRIGWNGSAFVVQSGNIVDSTYSSGYWGNLWLQDTAPANTVYGRFRFYTENQTGGTVYARKAQVRGAWGGPFPWSDDNSPFARSQSVYGAAVDSHMDSTARINDLYNGVPVGLALGVAGVLYPAAPLSQSGTTGIAVAATSYYYPGGSISIPAATIGGLANGTVYSVFYNTATGTFVAAQSGSGSGYATAQSGYIALGQIITQTSGGGQAPPPPSPPGYFGGSCPEPDAMILLANEDRSGPGNRTRAGDLTPLKDWVWTKHEKTGEYGAFQLLNATTITAERVRLILTDGRSRIFSDTQPLEVSPNLFWPIDRIKTGQTLHGTKEGTVVTVEKAEDGPVVHMTVEDAHTFDADGLNAHNKTQYAS